MRSAVTIETRPYTEDFVKRHFDYLDDEWRLVFFGSCFNKDRVLELYPDCLFIEVTPNYSYDWLNVFMISKEFWEAIPDEEILIFQYDSGILKKGIERFLTWDYVGAAWKNPLWGGNGGISIRKKSVMLKCIELHPKFTKYDHEDGYFCHIMNEYEIGKLAPRSVNLMFGVETVFTLGTYTYHKINGYLTSEECEQIMNQYK